jgi:hypothetical protein
MYSQHAAGCSTKYKENEHPCNLCPIACIFDAFKYYYYYLKPTRANRIADLLLY